MPAMETCFNILFGMLCPLAATLRRTPPDLPSALIQCAALDEVRAPEKLPLEAVRTMPAFLYAGFEWDQDAFEKQAVQSTELPHRKD